MKKLFLLICALSLLFSVPAFTQTHTYTTNYNWDLGYEGQTPWWDVWTGVLQSIDTSLHGVKQKTDAWVDVTQSPYNADPTGAIDSTAAIQAAINAGKIIYFPYGTYVVSSSIVLIDHMHLLGNGSTIINKNAAATYLLHVQGSDVEISNFNIVNTSYNIADSYNIFIGLSTNTTGYHNITIRHINATGGSDTAAPVFNIYAMGYLENVLIQNCLATGAYGYAFGAEWNGVSIYSPKNVRWDNCSIDGAVWAWWVSGSVNSIIENCTIKDSTNGIFFYRGDKGVETGYHISGIIRNCSFKGTSQIPIRIIAQDASGGHGDGAITDTFAVIVENNNFNGGTVGLEIVSTLGSVTVTNNIIENVVTGINIYDSSEGITIENNLFCNITGKAIYGERPKRSLIQNNKFREVSTASNSLMTDVAIHILSPAYDNRIIDNTFGTSNPTTRPYAWIYLQRTVADIPIKPQGHIITRNKFYRTESTIGIVNSGIFLGDDSYKAVNYIYDNFLMEDFAPTFFVYGAHPYRPIGSNKSVSGPLNSPPDAGTWEVGDEAHNTQVVGQPRGWICTAAGTFSLATDSTGDTDGSTAVITGMTDTSDFFVGEYVTVSAGFPTTGPYKILEKTVSTIKLGTISDSAQSNITVSTTDPIFTALPNL